MNIKFFLICAAAFFTIIIQVILFLGEKKEVLYNETEISWWEKDYNTDVNHYIHNITTTLLPKNFCLNPVKLLIIVPSAPPNLEARQAIRETWGSQKFVPGGIVNLFFFLGVTTNQTIQDLVITENERFGDIIQENFYDTYNNLTLKSTIILKDVTSYCLNTTKFLLKIDDDMYVNLPKMIKLIKGRRSVLLGRKVYYARPIRDPINKWYCPTYIYNQTFFPDYLSGTGYVMSIDVAKKLYETALTTPMINMEDVFITGLCAAKAKVYPQDNVKFKLNYEEENICSIKESVTVHHITPALMRTTYNEIKNIKVSKKCKSTPIFNALQFLRSLFLPLT